MAATCSAWNRRTRVSLCIWFCLAVVAVSAVAQTPIKFDSASVSGLPARNIGSAVMSGRFATLDAVIDHYAAGGRTIADGPYRGVGHDNPNKSPLIQGFSLTSDQKSDLIAYLKTLTDEELLHDPDLANPWEAR